MMSSWSWLVLCALAPALTLASSASGDRYHPERAGAGGPAPARAVSEAERSAAYWRAEAAAGIRSRLEARGQGAGAGGAARGVVLFLGDGMSVPTLAAARTLLGQRRNRTGEETRLAFETFPSVGLAKVMRPGGEEARLAFETFPSVGLAKTYCVDAQVPDSACTATAYLCGVKANQGTLGVTAAVPRRDCLASLDPSNRLDSIAAWALADGRDAGIVTTTRVTHASPAGAFARSSQRGWEHDASVRADGLDPALCPDIAHQLVHSSPGNLFKVILGGGRRNFLPNDTRDEEGTRGRRTDGRNLIEEWQRDKESRGVGYEYVWNRTSLLNLTNSPPEYLLGLFEGSHMQYHLEGDPATEPSLAELTEIAIRSLSRNPRGFFLFVEGGRIDHAHHDNYPHLALDETIELHRAVARAAELLAERDDLLVVTADHAHVMSFNGYSARGADVLGPSRDRDLDGVPYMTLSYTNGPGARRQPAGRRPDVTGDPDYRSLRWRSHADAPLRSETHGGDDVAVFALGPHHALFSGLYEQSQLPHLMAYAACLGAGPHACSPAHATRRDLLLVAIASLLSVCFLK